MTLPDKENRVHHWAYWPQQLAPNAVWRASGKGTGRSVSCSYLQAALTAARNLRSRLGTDEDIVVFCPRSKWGLLTKDLRRLRGSARVEAFRNVMISPTPRLREAFVAFRVKDVEAHRTPADAYFVEMRQAKQEMRKLNPEPLYTEAESKTGEEIHE